MAVRERLSGNEAVAYAIKQINPDVMPAFPITPSTEIPQYVANYIANGEIDTEFIHVESEHSAMSATIGASAAGARALTATSSCGMALMWEELYIAASDRLPIVLALVNRALTGPININADHSDSMGARDTGWIQIYAESNQEVYDNFIQAFPIAEDKSVHLPVMICQDGFITSHGVENILLVEDDKVKEFVGEYEPEHYLLNPAEKMAVGPYAVSNYYMETKRGQRQAMLNAKQVILEVAAKFEEMTGRRYGFFEEYQMEDAEYAVVIIGSAAGTCKAAIDEIRNTTGKKVGLIKIRVFRPFPEEELAKALSKVKAAAIMDRSEMFAATSGPLGAEVRAAMYQAHCEAEVVNYFYGLGGRDITVSDFMTVYDNLETMAKTHVVTGMYDYIGLRSGQSEEVMPPKNMEV
ncbi:MAG: pyruvate ferredoxin oxidoreductase [Lachnospiraceae bacterium]|nr:pyruvate ferredoxin oxidoreductase [Lachnospiraceae bacterium]